ncbi:MAG: YbjN domain-containing protein [Deltaproteobacteria bacterium]|nr:YbjN domain-containing protein [Deltaproteobacteria bacterium]MCZ6546849.1 YbjN domain-containing protein [Deltaproteobacteria bacterium]
MSEYFEKVKVFLVDMGYAISQENAEEELVIVNDEESGIKNLIVDCEDPILILEQMIMKVPGKPGDLFRRLLQMNRTLVHGAFVLDEEGKMVLFRDTLRLENLDQNELEGSIKALGLALAENAEELLSFSKK